MSDRDYLKGASETWASAYAWAKRPANWLHAKQPGEWPPWAWLIIVGIIAAAVAAHAAGLSPSDDASPTTTARPTTTAPVTTTAPPEPATTAPPVTTTTAPPPTTTTTSPPPPTTTTAPSPPTTAKPAPLFPGRVDAHKEDQERNVGDAAMLSGYTATVSDVSGAANDAEGFITADVTIVNRDQRTQPYSVYDWQLQTAAGRVIDPTFVSTLGSADLVHGGTATGVVIFRIGEEAGDFYLIYKPDSFDAARGIWKATVVPGVGVE